MAHDEPGRWEQPMREAALRVEEELRRVVSYINDEVVPEIRVNGSRALRIAAAELQKLAQQMEDRRSAGQSSPTGAPPAPGSTPNQDKSRP